MEDWQRILGATLEARGSRDFPAVVRAVRRTMFASLLDHSVTPNELRAELRAIVLGEPVGARPPGAAPDRRQPDAKPVSIALRSGPG